MEMGIKIHNHNNKWRVKCFPLGPLDFMNTQSLWICAKCVYPYVILTAGWRVDPCPSRVHPAPLLHSPTRTCRPIRKAQTAAHRTAQHTDGIQAKERRRLQKPSTHRVRGRNVTDGDGGVRRRIISTVTQVTILCSVGRARSGESVQSPSSQKTRAKKKSSKNVQYRRDVLQGGTDTKTHTFN